MTVIIVLVIGFGLGVILYSYFSSDKIVIRKKLKKAELKKISSFKNGEFGKVIGNVRFVDKPLTAPFSNRKCAFYDVEVEHKKSNGKNSYWDTIISERKHVSYLIKQDEHYAFINHKSLICYLVKDKNYSSGFGNDAEKHLEKFLNRHNAQSEGFFGMNRTLRYNEGILEENEEVAIFGEGNWKEASELGLPVSYGKVLEISAPVDDKVYLTDDVVVSIKQATKNHNVRRKSNRHEHRYLKK